MHVYIDDSGDGGYKFDSGSTNHLVMAAVVFREPQHISGLVELVEGCAEKNRRTSEFKYSNTKARVADCFFSCISRAKFDVRAIVIKKSLIYSKKLRESPSALKSYAIRMLLTKNYGNIRDAKIFIDGQDTKASEVGDDAYLKRMVNRDSPNTISQVRFVDSKASRPIQLADMVAGAINRSTRTDRASPNKHLLTFVSRTYQPKGTLWHFKPRPELFNS